MQDCLFCKIARKEIPANVVYEDSNTIAFLDISPASKGHTLVIPKKHCETLDKMDDKELNVLISTVKKVSKVISKICDGYNVLQNNNRAAGQLVDHVHFHIIPQYKESPIRVLEKSKPEISKEEMNQIKERIKTLLK